MSNRRTLGILAAVLVAAAAVGVAVYLKQTPSNPPPPPPDSAPLPPPDSSAPPPPYSRCTFPGGASSTPHHVGIAFGPTHVPPAKFGSFTGTQITATHSACLLADLEKK